MKKPLLAAALSFVTHLLLAQNQILPLYPGTIPDSKPSSVQEKSIKVADGTERISNVVQPTLAVYQPEKGKANGTAVIICPGGGYSRLSIDGEGREVAQRLNTMGVTAFVLKYRLPDDLSQVDKSIAPLLDAQQALRMVRQQAAKYGVNPQRVGIMGFSAGGHLASTAGTHFTKPVGDTKDNTSVRPDFLVLLYPVISFSDSLKHAGSRDNLIGKTPDAAQTKLYSNELQVSAQTPPTFLVHAQDDKTVPVKNSIVFYEACLHHQVPAEMHLYPKGGHGFGMHNKTTKDDWVASLQNWFDANGWLTK
ncbi:alpha/beta hydrolase [Hymenobacter sp. BT491]|uniref:alpha/beta hydrolase n=1 Tax=Hymenobacter sp. BT491 TaxID=2766779 RepID=UPI001653CD64|nr:alpha/beta hydrolase [Hymenobacter sp. BT491]MBC6989693.1 alpha/beta hydrolase [Hymenobacter sp. BT491]